MIIYENVLDANNFLRISQSKCALIWTNEKRQTQSHVLHLFPLKVLFPLTITEGMQRKHQHEELNNEVAFVTFPGRDPGVSL